MLAFKSVIRRRNALSFRVGMVIGDDINGRASPRPQTATARDAATSKGEIEQFLKRRSQLIP